jgi:hypothetical protein
VQAAASSTATAPTSDTLTLRQEGIPLDECLRAASSRPWPEPDGKYYSYLTLETWWYDYAKSGYPGLTGKSSRADAGKSRTIDPETGAWILQKIQENPKTPLQVLQRHWQEHGHQLPSISSIYRFLKAHGYDRRTLHAGRFEGAPSSTPPSPAGLKPSITSAPTAPPV